MTINDQIRDEKLQYDINREAAKISALSSGKIHKYEYLTGEEILPSNQQQIIEQAKFTYSPLGKAFEKQIKTIEDQWQKQVEVLKDLKSEEQTKAIVEKCDDEILMQKETYNRLLSERLDEIQEISKQIEYNNLTYPFKTKGISSIHFIKYKGPFNIFKEIRDGNKALQEIEKDQESLKSSLREIALGSPKYKEKYQLDTIKNVKNLRDSRQKVINLFNDNARIRSAAAYKSNQDETTGTGLKIFTPK